MMSQGNKLLRFVCWAFLFMMHLTSESQTISDVIDPNLSNESLLWNTNSKNSIKGSPYLFPSWSRCEVEFTGVNKTYEKLNIDLINGVVVVKVNDIIRALNSSFLIQVKKLSSEQVFVKGVDPLAGTFIFPELIKEDH